MECLLGNLQGTAKRHRRSSHRLWQQSTVFPAAAACLKPERRRVTTRLSFHNSWPLVSCRMLAPTSNARDYSISIKAAPPKYFRPTYFLLCQTMELALKAHPRRATIQQARAQGRSEAGIGALVLHGSFKSGTELADLSIPPHPKAPVCQPTDSPPGKALRLMDRFPFIC